MGALPPREPAMVEPHHGDIAGMASRRGEPAVVDFQGVRAPLDRMSTPVSEARSFALFEELMLELERVRQRKHRSRALVRALSAIVLTAAGAGVYLLLTR